jgi:hypothetical protein
MGRLAGSVIITVSFGAALLAALTPPVNARGGHGFGGSYGGHGGMHGAHFAAGGRHGNDPYIKAASDERDKLLNAKLKSICRGC